MMILNFKNKIFNDPIYFVNIEGRLQKTNATKFKYFVAFVKMVESIKLI